MACYFPPVYIIKKKKLYIVFIFYFNLGEGIIRTLYMCLGGVKTNTRLKRPRMTIRRRRVWPGSAPLWASLPARCFTPTGSVSHTRVMS